VRLRRGLRRAVDRLVAPYVDDIRADIRAEARAAAQGRDHDPTVAPVASNGDVVPSERFHQLNHELRTVALEAAPKGARTAVSIGASGRWYFDWFEACVGPVDLHIGVEAYEPEPDDLPAYVRWLPATADHLDAVDTASVDLVFAGQTTEHLWADELSGFLLGARRILRPGGWLVADSPNRSVTQHLRWSHGGHTVELSVAEFEELLGLAGFEVHMRKGLWRCRFGDRVLQLEESLDDPAVTLRRSLPSPPEDAFVWWVEAQRPAGDDPDEDALRRRVDDLFAAHWPTRVSRGMWPGPGADGLDLAPGSAGVLAESLHFPLHQGRWRLALTLQRGRLDDLDGLRVELLAPGGQSFADLTAATAAVDGSSVAWDFEIPYFVQALVMRLQATRVHRDVRVAMPLDLRHVPAPE